MQDIALHVPYNSTMKTKLPNPITEIRYTYKNKTVTTEWMYIDPKGYKKVFKEWRKAHNYITKTMKCYVWDTNVVTKAWQAPSVRPQNCKISKKKTSKKGIKNSDDYLRAVLKNTSPYKQEDVGCTVDFNKKPTKKNWVKTWL